MELSEKRAFGPLLLQCGCLTGGHSLSKFAPVVDSC